MQGPTLKASTLQASEASSQQDRILGKHLASSLVSEAAEGADLGLEAEDSESAPFSATTDMDAALDVDIRDGGQVEHAAQDLKQFPAPLNLSEHAERQPSVVAPALITGIASHEVWNTIWLCVTSFARMHTPMRARMFAFACPESCMDMHVYACI